MAETRGVVVKGQKNSDTWLGFIRKSTTEFKGSPDTLLYNGKNRPGISLHPIPLFHSSPLIEGPWAWSTTHGNGAAPSILVPRLRDRQQNSQKPQWWCRFDPATRYGWCIYLPKCRQGKHGKFFGKWTLSEHVSVSCCELTIRNRFPEVTSLSDFHDFHGTVTWWVFQKRVKPLLVVKVNSLRRSCEVIGAMKKLVV